MGAVSNVLALKGVQAFATTRRSPVHPSHAAPRHARRRQRLPGRPPRREPALAGPRGGGRARLHALRVRRDPPAGGGADRALRALARRDHRHRRKGDVLVRGPRRDRAHAASRGDRGRGARLPPRLPRAPARVRARPPGGPLSRLPPPPRAQPAAHARLQGGVVPGDHGARAGGGGQPVRGVPRAPGPGARAPRAGARGLCDESAPGARARLLLSDGLRGRRGRARRAERGGRGRALRRAGGGARRPGRRRRRLRARPRAPRHGGAGGRGGSPGSHRPHPPARRAGGGSGAGARHPAPRRRTRRGARAGRAEPEGAAPHRRPPARAPRGHPGRGGAAGRAGNGARSGAAPGPPPGRPARRERPRARARPAGDDRGWAVSAPIEALGDWRRSDECGVLRPTDVGRAVTLCGWVHARRDHGGVLFIDLRDRSGLVQIVCNPADSPAAHARAGEVRLEYVIAVRGELRARPAETVNVELPTGAVEVSVRELRVLNTARPTPYPTDDLTEVSEPNRLRYRYLHLRRPHVQRNLLLRHQVTRAVREYLNAAGFVEVETPVLMRSTPEGARDYLVPSRVQRGSFYALPQSPQIFKQLLMVAGLDRYYQIVRCFRDEDLRADRQPEFTQIDLEMSFVGPADVMAVVEPMIAALFTEVRGRPTPRPFPVLRHAEAMLRYGIDRPDLRVDLELADFTACFAGTGFRVFAEALAAGNPIRGLAVPGGGAALSRRELDDQVGFATAEGAGGLTWIKIGADGWQSPAVKFLSDAERERLTAAGRLAAGDLLVR